MKVFVAGASGRVAQELIKRLVLKGHTVLAGARKPQLIEQTEQVSPCALDLHSEVSELQDLLNGVDVVYFTAGSRGQDLLQTDVFGAIKLMQAAEKAGVKRFIMLSSLFALEPEKWSEAGLSELMDYNIAKFLADNYLIHQTNLDYTILQPGALLEAPATGKIQINPHTVGSNPIADVAQVLATIINLPQTSKQVIKMISGGEAIDQALADL